MDLLKDLLDLFLHLDVHLAELIARYGVWTYGILFLIVFCETGLVVTPFLPGDSLLFAAGTFSGMGSFHLAVLFPVLFCASVLGRFHQLLGWPVHWPAGPSAGHIRFLRQDYLDRTEDLLSPARGEDRDSGPVSPDPQDVRPVRRRGRPAALPPFPRLQPGR